MTRLSTSILIALAAIAWVCSAAAPSATCEHPAPIMGKWDAAAPGYVVAVRNDTDLETVLTRLARKCNFKLLRLRVIHGFMVSSLSDEVLEQLRCEEVVEWIEHDQSTSTG